MIIIGADHGGYELKESIKEYLQEKNYDIVDVGAFELDDQDDFSHFVKLLTSAFDHSNGKSNSINNIDNVNNSNINAINNNNSNINNNSNNNYNVRNKNSNNDTNINNNENSPKIIAVCGSGVGMSIGLNKHKGIFCALGYSKEEVTLARQHNHINALALGGKNVNKEEAIEMVDAFLSTGELGGKYTRRMSEIDE